MGRGTPIFSFETPSRERTGHDTNRSTRELLRDITGSNHGDSPGVGKTGSGNGSGSGRCVGKTGIWEREITWSGYLFYY